jgi:aldose 1-epimerase
MRSVLDLNHGDLAATIHGECGGSITSFRIQTPTGSVDLLRPTPEEAILEKDGRASSCYPLVPYSNRIENGLLNFQGRLWRSERTFPNHPHTLHGHGFKGQWWVERSNASSGELAFEYEGDDFPSAYQARQRFTLSDSALTVEMILRNTGGEAMPAGMGFHPFFPKTQDTRLQVALDGVWLMAANDGIPTEHVQVPPGWDFSELRELGDVVLDHCFTGWQSQRAVIEWPSRALRVTMTAEGPLKFIILYTPAGETFFCVEPVSNMNNAFNRAEKGEENTGTVVLKPGDELSAQMRLLVQRI